MDRLSRSHVPRNLDFSPRFLGLSLTDLPLILIPPFCVNGASSVVDISPLWVPTCALASAAFVFLVRFRKPEGYLEGLILSAFYPRRLSHKAADMSVSPFSLRGGEQGAGEER